MKTVPGEDKNAFASYCLRNKIEEKPEGEDVIPIGEAGERIESTYKDTKDTIYL